MRISDTPISETIDINLFLEYSKQNSMSTYSIWPKLKFLGKKYITYMLWISERGLPHSSHASFSLSQEKVQYARSITLIK